MQPAPPPKRPQWIEIATLAFAGSALWGCTGPFKSTYQGTLDRCGAACLALPTLLLALAAHPNLNKNFVSDVAWTYALYLEASALVPQLVLLRQRAAVLADRLTAHFVAALGCGRLLECLFWACYHRDLSMGARSLPGYLVVVSQLVQLAQVLDFFYGYYQAVTTPFVVTARLV